MYLLCFMLLILPNRDFFCRCHALAIHDVKTFHQKVYFSSLDFYFVCMCFYFDLFDVLIAFMSSGVGENPHFFMKYYTPSFSIKCLPFHDSWENNVRNSCRIFGVWLVFSTKFITVFVAFAVLGEPHCESIFENFLAMCHWKFRPNVFRVVFKGNEWCRLEWNDNSSA